MWETFSEIFKVPNVCKPHIAAMISEDEKALVVAFKGNEFTITDVIKILDIPRLQAEQLIEKAYRKGILNKINDKMETYISTDLYTRLKYAAVFDDYDNIPLLDRNDIDEWYIRAFIEKHSENFQKLKENILDLDTVSHLFSHTPFLLEQTYEAIDVADRILLVPCDCNQLSEHRIDRSNVSHCILFDNYADGYMERSLGKVLTKDECKKIVREADKQGFVHCVNMNFKTAGPEFICNCNPKWCYPYRAAKIMQSESYYPLRRNIANYNSEECLSCGLCVKRCPFDAFSYSDRQIEVGGKLKNQIEFNIQMCQGCGLCANTCSQKAIIMNSIEK